MKGFAYNLLPRKNETEGEAEDDQENGAGNNEEGDKAEEGKEDDGEPSDPNRNNYNPFIPNFSPDVKPIIGDDNNYHPSPAT